MEKRPETFVSQNNHEFFPHCHFETREAFKTKTLSFSVSHALPLSLPLFEKPLKLCLQTFQFRRRVILSFFSLLSLALARFGFVVAGGSMARALSSLRLKRPPRSTRLREQATKSSKTRIGKSLNIPVTKILPCLCFSPSLSCPVSFSFSSFISSVFHCGVCERDSSRSFVVFNALRGIN